MTIDASDFYSKAERVNMPDASPPPENETPAQRFYRVAERASHGQASDSNSPKPAPTATASPPAPTAAPTAAVPAVDPATAAIVANLKTLGVELPAGLDPTQGIAFHDAAIKAHRATQDAEVAGWEAQTRRDVPQHEIASAEAFAATHLDDEIRGVLASSGLGSHPGIVRLAAKLQAALSRR
jgi:hypothetical protein